MSSVSRWKRSRNFGVGGDVLVHHLDDDMATEVDLPGEVNAAHAAFAEETAGLIAAQENAADHGATRAPVPKWSVHARCERALNNRLKKRAMPMSCG